MERLQWELTLQDELRREHRTPCDYLTQAGQFIYCSPWIGVGGMLFRTLGDAVSGKERLRNSENWRSNKPISRLV